MSVVTTLAQLITGVDVPKVNANSATLANILNAVYFWAGILATIMIIIGALFYVLSRGEASRVKAAKDTIFGAVIGLVIVLLAFVITNFVLGQF